MNTNTSSPKIKIVNANKDLRHLNMVGKRIVWCRQQLGLEIMEVCRAVRIPCSSYSARENGARAQYHEEYLALAMFFDSKWKAKHGQSFPSYQGMEIDRVRVAWLMFGIVE